MKNSCAKAANERSPTKGSAAALRSVGSIGTENIGGVDIEYWRAGSCGRPIVFLHGNSSAKEVFTRQFSHFDEGGQTLIAIDLPGHGGSANAVEPAGQYTIPGYAEIVQRLLEHLKIRDYVLVGWSLGGNIALEMAGRDYPLHAMLIMGAPPVGPGAENFDKAYLPATAESAASKRDPGDEEITAFARSIYGSLNPVPEWFLETARRTDGLARETMVSHWLSGESGCDQLETAKTSDKAICVAHGADEPFVSLPYLRAADWKNLWKDKIHIVSNSAHAPFIENSESFNVLLESFAASVN